MASPPGPPPPDKSLILSVVHLSSSLASFQRPKSVLQKRNIASVVRKTHFLSVLFEEVLFVCDVDDAFPLPAILCFREILTVLRRFESLLHTCFKRFSRMQLLLQSYPVSDEFQQLTHDLSALLNMFPWDDMDVSNDVRDLANLLQQQCRRSDRNEDHDPAEEDLLSEIREMLDDIERKIVPQRCRMEWMFKKLGLSDSERCEEEIAKLETEIREGVSGYGTVTMVSLLGLVRYAKCVLFRSFTPRYYPDAVVNETGNFTRCLSFSTVAVPNDFRCPISLDLMIDPVAVKSGQTYDRESISNWINSGHATCPKTGQKLSDLFLIPNFALKNLIAQWCRDQNPPIQLKETSPSSCSSSSTSQIKRGMSFSKAALEAARMTALFLIKELSASNSTEAANLIVHELRQLSKTGSENRIFIAEAGAIPLLLPLLNSSDPSLQVNAVTTLFNLSILEDNKKRILNTQDGLECIVRVLGFGATWCARENTAATLLSLSSLHSVYRKIVGREAGVAEGLAELVRSGPISSKSGGLIAILNLAGVRENIDRLVEGGVVSAVLEAVKENDVMEMAVAVFAAVAKRGGAKAISVVDGFVERMVWVLREGTDSAKESAASALVHVCKLGGNNKPMEELAMEPGIEWVVWRMMMSRSARARRKARALGGICRSNLRNR